MPRIYLDNAATTWPKPESVYESVDRWMRDNGAAAGRAAYDEAGETDRLVDAARRDTARLLGVADPRRIVFTLNGTDSLNLAIHGLIRPGDHVVTTVCEHNSVLRPLKQLEELRGVAVTHVGCNEHGIVSTDDVLKAVNSKTRFVVLTAASNVTGALQPLDVGEELRRRDIPLVVDAAQAVGEVPFNLDADEPCCDILAAPGHKGLLGPLGSGILYVRPGLEDRLRSVRTGGTGSESQSLRQPSKMPDRYESGNLNVPAVVGLGAGVRYLLNRGIAAVREHAVALTTRLLEGTAGLDGVRVVGPPSAEARVGVVSFTIRGYDPQELAAGLATAYGIQVRAGLQCAPLMHKALKTDSLGGTLRVSFGPFNTTEDVDVLVTAIRELAAAAT